MRSSGKLAWHRRRNKAATGKCFVYGRDEIRSQARFLDIAQRPFRKAGTDKGGVFIHGQKYKFYHRSSRAEFTRSLDSSEYWHGDVQYNHIGLKALCFHEQIPAIIGGPHHFKARI